MEVTLKLKLTPEIKEKYAQVCSEVIDLMRKKYGLDSVECAAVLEILQDGLADTIQEEFLKELYPAIFKKRVKKV